MTPTNVDVGSDRAMKVPTFQMVPNWAPKKGKYTELVKRIERFLIHLINETKSMKFCDNADLRIKVSNDMDILKLCETINALRLLNLKICDNTIFLPTGETYEVEMSEDLEEKVNDLPNRLNLFKAHNMNISNDNDYEYSVTGDLEEWKETHDINKIIASVSALYERLMSFYDKREKINFASVSLKNYTISLSETRIDLDAISIRFLETFLK